MPDIPVDSPLSYLGIVLLLFGGFLIVTGTKIITIEKVSVTSGPRTWGAGIAVLIIGFLVLLYDFPIAEPGPLPQNRMDAAGQPTITPLSQSLIAEDQFLDNRLDWHIGVTSDEFADVEAVIINGKYINAIHAKRDVVYRSYALSVTDFRLQIEATITDTTALEGEAAVVLTFRDNHQGNYYIVEFFTDHTFQVRLRNEDRFETMLAKTLADTIRLTPGSPNIFGLQVQDGTFIIFANGEQIGLVSDETLAGPGAIGLGGSLGQAGDDLTIEYDNFLLEKVP